MEHNKSQSDACNLPHPPKITLSHWLFFLGYFLYPELCLVQKLSSDLAFALNDEGYRVYLVRRRRS